ncbi:MAG: iron-sulfur cluster assembly accessory protein [Propionibacteriaceae bacterium]|jgi:iron-sulfur cluster assembly accessory protein|nr:iron-sulfur cluster assembly accessory protein [Propionibacteriaceae bacterium]
MTITGAQIGLALTDAAITKVTELLADQTPGIGLRVKVQPACSGFQYELYFDDESLPGDLEQLLGAVRLVVDEASAPYLVGATITFDDDQGFTIDNPNATNGCACDSATC